MLCELRVQACLSLYLVIVRQILTHNSISESVCVKGCEEEVCVIKKKESEGRQTKRGRVLCCECLLWWRQRCRSGQGGGVVLSWGRSLNSDIQSFTQTQSHTVSHTQSVTHSQSHERCSHSQRGRRHQQHIWWDLQLFVMLSLYSLLHYDIIQRSIMCVWVTLGKTVNDSSLVSLK